MNSELPQTDDMSHEWTRNETELKILFYIQVLKWNFRIISPGEIQNQFNFQMMNNLKYVFWVFYWNQNINNATVEVK